MSDIVCPRCGSTEYQKRGTKRNKRAYSCKNCRKRYYIHMEEAGQDKQAPSFSSSVESNKNSMHVTFASYELPTEESIISQFHIDTSKWEISSIKVKTTYGYRKDRKVDWEVKDGVVINGNVKDSGRMLLVPIHNISASFSRKVEQIQSESLLEEFKQEAKTFAPIYPNLTYKNSSSGYLLELDFPDIHLGRLTWNEESGQDYDLKIAIDTVNTVLAKLLDYAKNYPISKIILPIGNDFFNVDSKEETTTHGTRQQEDTRWQKTFRAGRQLAISMIDACSSIAPVDVLVIAGNHDEQRSFYLGDVLEAWYHNNPNVNIDNDARKRKYYPFGKCLIGFTHGYWEPIVKLPLIMAQEVPELWAKAEHREIHTGDKHHRKDVQFRADEGSGIVVRIISSLAGTDTWTFDKGYIGAKKAAQSFLWDADNGLIAQFTASP